ncbi:MAG TPA: hypothetical protein VIW80_11810 [Pyrinomonadaceae bacterium]
MEQKRKIIIPLGGSREAIPARDLDGATTAQAPLFDAEATLGARPVVPLAAAPVHSSRHFPLLALVVVLAIAAGVAGGFAIGLYRSRQLQQSAATPTPATTTTASTTTASADATAQTPAQQLPAAIASSEKTPAPVEPERTTASNAPAEHTARDNKPKRDEEQVIPPVEVRERAKEKSDREVRDREDLDREDKIARDEERELKRQRRERRRRARDNDEANGDVNQQIERGARELNRIREIFEGQRP